ncbi:hypothetical protein C8Q73DRAFT_693886 [Cubamyces lactineus]|nr:hypothetical protein C8Q73DRAFT_693886 [Cubamyces lactineus]
MGVPGLWEILRPAGKPRSLTHLAVKDGFEANPDGKRGFRVGIDASIWFYHATYGREGENPELRTLFFRCTRLMSMPFLPLFVFDGPKRPDVKRGKRITGKNHWMVQGMQEIITAFGFEWRMAPGEAEAELAYLNRIGVIDAVLSDDVDTFLFGAKTVVRNPNATLSGNRAHSLKNAAGKDDGNHSMVYRSEDILNHEDIKLTQGGLILIGILRGGDYCQEGLDGCGVAIAHGLAKAGFGDSLLNAARTMSRDDFEEFLDEWRDEMRKELRTNARGHLPRKSPKLARNIPSDFPNIDVVLAYTNPVTSEAKGPGHKNAVVNWDKEPDLGKIAGLCEMYFEWGIKEIIIKRFRTVLWPSAVLRILRRAVILKDRKAALLTSRSAAQGSLVPSTPRKIGKERRAPPGTPSSMITRHFSTMRLDSPQASRHAALDEDDEDEDGERLIVKIHSSRRHASTDNILEYRLEIAPAQLVRLCEAGVKGLRTALPPDLSDSDDDGGSDDDEGGGGKKGKKKTKTPPPDPDSHLRIWLPACMVEIVEPELVEEFEGIERKKAEKKAAKAVKSSGKSSGPTGARNRKKLPAIAVEEEESSSSQSDVEDQRQNKPKTAPPAKRSSQPANNTRADATSKTMDQFFAAKKASTAAGMKTSKVPASTAARVADLFKDVPSTTTSRSRVTSTLESSDNSDDAREISKPMRHSSTSTKVAVASSTTIASPRAASSRILNFLETQTTQTAAGPSKSLSKPSAPPVAALASTSSPPKSRALRPFPMDLNDFFNDPPKSSPADEDLFATDHTSSRTSSTHTRARSNISSDSDSRRSELQKSPRRSEKHSSPRNTPSKKTNGNAALNARREEEEESSFDDDRPPSPSPYKSRGATTLLSSRATSSAAIRREEEEESDRAPSPSPMRRRMLPTSKPMNGTRKPPPPLPANLTIISISSDSEDDPPPSLKVAPLQQARARLGKPAQKPASLPATSAQPARAARKPPPRTCDPDDVIDLT